MNGELNTEKLYFKKTDIFAKNKKPIVNGCFGKAVVSGFYDSEVLNTSFVHLRKFSAEKPRLIKAAKRWQKLQCP